MMEHGSGPQRAHDDVDGLPEAVVRKKHQSLHRREVGLQQNLKARLRQPRSKTEQQSCPG